MILNGSSQLSFMNPYITLTASFTGSSLLWNNGMTASSIVVNQPGSYAFTVTDVNGCTATSRPVSINDNRCFPPKPPGINLSGSNVITAGQTVTLTSTNAASYLWSTGDTTQSITVSTAGTYWVRSYSSPNCYSTSTPVNIYVAPARLTQQEYDDQLMLFPNPASNEFRIVFHALEEKDYTLAVTDASGKTIMLENIHAHNGRNTLNRALEGWSPGIYHVTLTFSDRQRSVRLVVQ